MFKKIALVHDYIKEYGGAERVLEALHDMYPDAAVYTLVYCPEFLGPHKERFQQWDIRTSFLQGIPYKHKLISPIRLLAPLAFKTFDFSNFDIIIVSATGAYNPNIIEKKSAWQICYCHTPPRYLYGYATARNWKNNPLLRILGETANHILRLVDYRSSQNVDQFIANSANVANRIKKFYKKESIVVYPPVKTFPVDSSQLKPRKPTVNHSTQHAHNSKLIEEEQRTKNYYLTGGRLARAKHYDLIIKACAELGVSLKVFGKGFAGYDEELKALTAYPNIEFLGEIDDEEKRKLMREAMAFIFAGEDEDFGIIPVEAMSVGTPVIAYKSGGVLETVIDQKTGVFFDELTIESLLTAIHKLGKMKIKSQNCINQAEKFSEERFKIKIQKIVDHIS